MAREHGDRGLDRGNSDLVVSLVVLYSHGTHPPNSIENRPKRLTLAPVRETLPSFGVEGSLDHTDVEGGVLEDGGPLPVAGKPLHGSAFVSAQGGAFRYVARKDNLGVSRPDSSLGCETPSSLMTPPEGL
jgi:hypothetical protein